MHDTALLANYLTLGALLFALGLAGFLVRRNLIVMFLCLEMMLQGVSLSLVAWSRFHGDWGGQMVTLFIITVAACEAGLGLSLVLVLFVRSGRLDIAFWQDLREEGQAPFADAEVPEEAQAEQVWPLLTPAGHEPAHDPHQDLYRSHV